MHLTCPLYYHQLHTIAQHASHRRFVHVPLSHCCLCRSHVAIPSTSRVDRAGRPRSVVHPAAHKLSSNTILTIAPILSFFSRSRFPTNCRNRKLPLQPVCSHGLVMHCFSSSPFISVRSTMIRIKDPKASLKFYEDVLGMDVIDTHKADDFTL